MSKLWIVHNQARARDALARLSGLGPEDRVEGEPLDPVFTGASTPCVLLMGMGDDLERELDFLVEHEQRLGDAQRLYLVRPRDAARVRRLTGAAPADLIPIPPDPRGLRRRVAEALSHGPTQSLRARRDRARVAHGFERWFGEEALPGLRRALDPALSRLPLVVRGVRGSGRSLVARHIESLRRTPAPTRSIRLSADTDDPLEALQRTAGLERPGAHETGAPDATQLWLENVDDFTPSSQRLIAEWIRLGPPPESGLGAAPRWVATAGPPTGLDGLEQDLAAALGPLVVTIPALEEAPEATEAFAERVVLDWANRFGGPSRHLSRDALAVLRTIAWAGDRLAVEQALQRVLVQGGEAPIRAEDIDTDLASLHAWRDAASEAAPHEVKGEGDRPAPITHETHRPEPTSNVLPDPPLAWQASPGIAEDPSRLMTEEVFGQAAAAPEPPLADWRKLARSLSHEIRNPLVSIRTFAELLPEHFEDASFRERFSELVGRDVRHIDDVIDRLARAAEREKPEPAAVDVSALIEQLLDARRAEIGERRLLVLRELERETPIAWADPGNLEIALAGLLDRALAALPERGDLFVATRRIERGPDGTPQLRVLMRHHSPEAAGVASASVPDAALAANAIEYVLAETVISASGGRLTIDANDAQETLILIDLRTPAGSESTEVLDASMRDGGGAVGSGH